MPDTATRRLLRRAADTMPHETGCAYLCQPIQTRPACDCIRAELAEHLGADDAVTIAPGDQAPLAAILANYLTVTRWADIPGGEPRQPNATAATLRQRRTARRLYAQLAQQEATRG